MIGRVWVVILSLVVLWQTLAILHLDDGMRRVVNKHNMVVKQVYKLSN